MLLVTDKNIIKLNLGKECLTKVEGKCIEYIKLVSVNIKNKMQIISKDISDYSYNILTH